MKIIKSKLLSAYKDIIHGVSTRYGLGRPAPFYFNLSLTVGDNKDNVFENRKTFLSYLGIKNAVYQQQTHSGNVTIVKHEGNVENNDAIITDVKNLALIVSLADCTPILLYDVVNKVIAGVHSGWRGTEKRILLKTLNLMNEKFGTQSKDLIAYIGPSICVNHYEVGSEVAEKFDEKYLKFSGDKFYLNVSLANYDMLIDWGVPKNNIDYSQLCTYEEDYLHSYRRDCMQSGRMHAAIMMRDADE